MASWGRTAFASLDAFPKIAAEYRVSTRYGGLLSILGALVVCWLVTIESLAFLDVTTVYDANIDTARSVEHIVNINFDITIASRCEHVSADVIDVAGAHIGEIGHSLMRQPVQWAVTPPSDEAVDGYWKDKNYRSLQGLAAIMSAAMGVPAENEEQSKDSVLPMVRLSALAGAAREHTKRGAAERLPIVSTARARGSGDINATVELPRAESPNAPPALALDAIARAPAELNACRIYGVLPVSKVQGNFHITAGRSVDMGGMHGHDVASVPMDKLNFTHKVHRFSVGENWDGISTPLDSVVQHTTVAGRAYFYALKIVPTRYIESSGWFTSGRDFETNQYAATFRATTIAPGQRALPGLFFNYNFEAVRLTVHERMMSGAHYITRVLAIAGGVFATVNMFASFSHTGTDFVTWISSRARGGLRR